MEMMVILSQTKFSFLSPRSKWNSLNFCATLILLLSENSKRMEYVHEIMKEFASRNQENISTLHLSKLTGDSMSFGSSAIGVNFAPFAPTSSQPRA